MKLDRAEWTGTGAALLFHVALIGALSLSLAHVASIPEPPSMEVEFVEDVGLTSAAPAPATTPPPAAESPAVEPVPEPDQATPVPVPEPRPAPKVAPQTPARAAPSKAAPARPAPRAPRLGDDFLKGIADSPPGKAIRPAAATVSPAAMGSIISAIRRQVQPCADRQVNPGPGASRIRVKMNLQLAPNGRLKRPPQILGTSGVDDDNAQYEERVKDLAVAIVAGCAPFTGLPPDLYKTQSGQGWSNINMNYNLP